MRLYFKDLFTAGNLLAGFAAALFAMLGEPMAAALMMPVAMFFDAFDGLVARLTNRGNRFGVEFDNVADHMSYGIAPGFILFASYRPVFAQELGWENWLATAAAFVVGAVPVFTSSVRFARFNSYRYDTSGYWIGVPRPVTGFALAALVNSHLFTHSTPARLGALLLAGAFTALNLSTHAYPNHKHVGGNPRAIWAYYGIFVATGVLVIVLGPLLHMVPNAYVGDVILMCMACYSFFGWIEIPGSHRARMRDAVWSAEQADFPREKLVVWERTVTPEGDAPGRVWAALAYFPLPIVSGLLLQRRSIGQRTLFHAWQGLMCSISLVVIGLSTWMLAGVWVLVLPGLPLELLLVPVALFCVVVLVVTAAGALAGRQTRAPIVARMVDKQMA